MRSTLTNFCLATLGIASLLACSKAEDVTQPWLDAVQEHPHTAADLSTYWLYDLGVVDANQDGLQDFYTTAHMARGSLLIDRGDQYEDQLSQRGLDAYPAVPWLAPMDTEPLFEKPGLYLWMHQTQIYLRAHGFADGESARLTLSFDYPHGFDQEPVDIEHQQHATATLSETVQPDGDRTITLNLQMDVGGSIILKTYLTALVMEVELGPNFAPERFYRGFDAIPADSTSSTLRWRDRHGWAWTRSPTGQPWLYIANGGLKGALGLYRSHDWVNDEFWELPASGGARDIYPQSRLSKGDCRTYRVMFIDVDGDGNQDLSRSCAGASVEVLYGNEDGSFGEAVSVSAKKVAAGDQFQWFDLDQDSDLDLVYEAGGGIWSAVQANKIFESLKLVADVNVERLALADADGDLDIDVTAFLFDADSLQLTNTDGQLDPRPLKTLGLPARGATGGWVDANFDGLIDYHDVPNGLYLGNPNGTFLETKLLADAGNLQKDLVSGLTAWFDAEADGQWDVIVATYGFIQRKIHDERRKNMDRRQSLGGWWDRRYRNLPSSHNWLGLKLQSNSGHPQGAAASVYLRTAAGTQLQVVGQLDFSHFSQSSFGLMFGLGDEQSGASVTVIWPDGDCGFQKNIDVNQWLTLKRSKLQPCSPDH